jgi:hypothetical protein
VQGKRKELGSYGESKEISSAKCSAPSSQMFGSIPHFRFVPGLQELYHCRGLFVAKISCVSSNFFIYKISVKVDLEQVRESNFVVVLEPCGQPKMSKSTILSCEN